MKFEEEKKKMIEHIDKSWRLLFSNLDKVPMERWEEAGVINKWSIKDILAHLYEWHNMLDMWHTKGLKGIILEKPMPGYKWSQLKDVNEIIYQQYRDMKLGDVLENLERTHKRVIKLADDTPAEAIFTRGYYEWTGNSYFKGYIRANSSGHYNWAKKHIRKWMRDQDLI